MTRARPRVEEDIVSDYLGKETKKLGFGLMRLPRRGVSIDVDQVSEMVDLFLDAGFTYFDTAYIYPGSEAAIRKALVDRHPRDSFTLATKLNAYIMATGEKSAKKQFYRSLERTGAGYFDYYLLHSLMGATTSRYDRYDIWGFAQERKEEGLIRHVGFSFHSGPKLLDRLLRDHPEVDFVQLQINYADWEKPSVTSRANYEVAREHGKPIVIMEPVKGGALANPPKQARDLFDACHPGLSYASWAIRFAASLDGVITVLSGMSNLAQMRDNISYMKDFKPLDDEEQEIIRKAQRIIGHSSTIDCTACHYCTSGCPKDIPIPEIFAAMNKQLGNGQTEQAIAGYEQATTAHGKASDCIRCGQCEQACPQHLPVMRLLEQCARSLER